MEADKIRIKTFLTIISIILIIEIFFSITIFKIFHNNLASIGVLRLAEIFFMILVVLKYGRGAGDIGLASSSLTSGIIKGFIWSVCFLAVVSVIALIIFFTGTNPLTLLKLNLPKGTGDLILFLVIAGIVGPVAEEIFFRGIIFGFFRRWGVFTALVLCTAFFVLLHNIKGFPLIQVAGGILFAVAYEVEGNLMTPITIHILGNMAIFALALVQ